MTLENILRGTGDIGAMLCTCWGVRQIDAEHNRIFVQNVKPRDFQPCKPFIIQGRPIIDATGYFDLAEPPGFPGELADHLGKGGRPTIGEDKKSEAQRLRAEEMSLRYRRRIGRWEEHSRTMAYRFKESAMNRSMLLGTSVVCRNAVAKATAPV